MNKYKTGKIILNPFLWNIDIIKFLDLRILKITTKIFKVLKFNISEVSDHWDSNFYISEEIFNVKITYCFHILKIKKLI